VAAAAVAVWLLAGGHRPLRALLESPETGIRRALASGAAGGAPEASGGIRKLAVRYRDPVVTSLAAAAEVVVVADAEGEVDLLGRPVAVSYLGRERLRMVRCRAGWCVEGERLPRLTAVLGLLRRRAEAFDRADAAAYGALVDDAYRGAEGGKPELLRRLAADLGASPRARLRPLAWQVRIERETAQVGEDYEIAIGGAPARRLRARLDLREADGGWRFTGGL
jgi:hypothetical protein